MKEYNYPGYETQKKRHTQFKLKIMELNLDVWNHKDSVPSDLLNYLKEWWSNHILEEDMQYRSFFNEQGLK